MRAFARHFRARYQPLFELTTAMQVSLLHLARADMDRLPPCIVAARKLTSC